MNPTLPYRHAVQRDDPFMRFLKGRSDYSRAAQERRRRLLAELEEQCRALSRESSTFVLGCREAARLLGHACAATEAAGLLRELVESGRLELVARGRFAGGHGNPASTYRFTAEVR